MKNVAVLALLVSSWVRFIAGAELSWDLRSVDQGRYTTLIAGLRNELRGSTCFQIPMVARPPSPTQYIIIKFIVTTTNNIYIALDKSNAYVVGYADTFNGKQRAFLLSDAPANANRNAFPNAFAAGQVITLNYGGSYMQLEKNAEISRNNLGLTRKILLSRATTIFGVAATGDRTFRRNQAQFFLVAVQMVSEAARFRYIEGQLTAHLNDASYTPNPKIINIVNQWGTISNAVARANANGNFQSPITLTNANGGTYTASKVEDVRQDMGILLYVATPCAKPVFDLFVGLNV